MADEVRGKELQEIIPTGDENPSALRWYELVEDEYILTEDTAVDPNKTYYKAKVMSFDWVTPVSGDNPAQNGWYEVEDNWFILTSDTEVVSGKAYYEYHTTATTDNGDIAKFKPKIQAFEEASVGAKVKDALVDAIAYCNTLHSIRFGMEAKN